LRTHINQHTNNPKMESTQAEKDKALNANRLRFFRILTKLPMDLQMLICNRVYKQTNDVIPFNISEAGFKTVYKKMQLMEKA